jgi:hypothetical protein
MRERIPSITILIVVLVSGSAAFCQQTITLENSDLRISLSPKSATLLDAFRKPSTISYLGSSKQTGWFRIQIPLPYWEGHTAASRDLKGVHVQKGGPDSAELRATRLLTKEGTYAINTQLILRLDRDNLVCRLRVQNQSKETIDRIIFPIVDVPAPADSQEALVLPQIAFPLRMAFDGNDVRTAHNPFDTADPLDLKAWFFSDPKVSVKAFNYPIYLPTAWFTLVGGGKGIGFDVRDRNFQFQKFLIERRLYRDTQSREANQRDYELSWNWYPLVRPGGEWESPEIYIKFDQGDWHGIAAQHRDWMKDWIRRPNVARKFQSSIGWLSRNIRSYDEIPRIAEQGVKVGAPYFIIYGWSKITAGGMSHSAYARTDLGGLESLQRNLRKARELGSHPMAWYNGTLSVETNPTHLIQANQWLALDRWGGEIVGGQWSLFEPLQMATSPNNDTWLEIDPTTGVKNYMLDTVRRFVEDYHFSGFEMDQAYKFFLSYRDAAQNGQPADAFSKGYADFYTRASELVKKNDPDGMIVGEGYSDFLNQYVDSSWIFEGGALNVPQLSALRYSLPWITVPVRAVVTDQGHANQAFMMNAPLDIFDDLTKHADYANHLERLHALKKSTWQYFYRGEFSDGEGFTLPGAAPKEVMAKSYRDPTGKFLAVVVVNTKAAAQATTLRPAEGFAARGVRRYYLDGRTETQKPSAEVRLELPAFDVQVLVFETA